MKHSLLTFFVLFSINNLLHHISEKVIIVVFIVFLFFLMRFLSSALSKEFRFKLIHILDNINMYMNAVFNFLYMNKLLYLNVYSMLKNYTKLLDRISGQIIHLAAFAALDKRNHPLINN